MALLALGASLLAGAATGACGSGSGSGSGSTPAGTFTIGAIPDQDPQKLQRLYGTVADYLSSHLHVSVRYRPVTDYTAAVSLFRSGDLDMVWFGGLTGVQARLQVPGSQAIVQRDVDQAFQSVFIVNSSVALPPVTTVAGLSRLRGLRFTFGSESSTSGRLMPEYFMRQAGVGEGDLAGPPGFSGSHDQTIRLVEAGAYQAGALNRQVWTARLADRSADPSRVRELFVTPPFHDYHWLIRPDADQRFGAGFTVRVTSTLIGIDAAEPAGRQVLALFGAHRFVPTSNANYGQIEAVGRSLGLVR